MGQTGTGVLLWGRGPGNCDGSKKRVKVIWSVFRPVLWAEGGSKFPRITHWILNWLTDQFRRIIGHKKTARNRVTIGLFVIHNSHSYTFTAWRPQQSHLPLVPLGTERRGFHMSLYPSVWQEAASGAICHQYHWHWAAGALWHWVWCMVTLSWCPLCPHCVMSARRDWSLCHTGHCTPAMVTTVLTLYTVQPQDEGWIWQRQYNVWETKFRNTIIIIN